MREVYCGPDVTQVGYYKSVLSDAGISCFIRNENANSIGLAGAMFFPALCVTNDVDYDEAIRALKSRQFQAAPPAADWTCATCTEKNPGNFELCWNCNAPRPALDLSP